MPYKNGEFSALDVIHYFLTHEGKKKKYESLRLECKLAVQELQEISNSLRHSADVLERIVARKVDYSIGLPSHREPLLHNVGLQLEILRAKIDALSLQAHRVNEEAGSTYVW